MLFEDEIIAYTNPKSPVSEAYRVLRTNIQYSGFDKPIKTIVVTSSGPMEGKTTTIVNLAVTFAQAGSKVLLIDSDLRKPRIHKLMNLSNKIGLTNYLTRHDEYENYIYTNVVQGLDVFTCGVIPPNPSELLSSNSMRQFIEEVKKVYDIILMDAPPVGSVTDASIISTYVDGTILVANSGRVQIEALLHAKELLQKVNANILGVVLNNLDKKASGNYYYYQYYYYGTADGDVSKKRKRLRKKKKIENQPENLA